MKPDQDDIDALRDWAFDPANRRDHTDACLSILRVMNGISTLRSEVKRLRLERDTLINSCIFESRRIFPDGKSKPGWGWWFKGAGGFSTNHPDAVRIVRMAAGLETEEVPLL